MFSPSSTEKSYISRSSSQQLLLSVEATASDSAGEEVTKCLVTALVLSMYSTIATLHSQAFPGRPPPLQAAACIHNAAVHLITYTKHRDNITPVLIRLHWLPIKSRIIHKLCFQMHIIKRSTSMPIRRWSNLTTWPRWSNAVQHARRGLAFVLPVTYCIIREASAEALVRWATLQ